MNTHGGGGTPPRPPTSTLIWSQWSPSRPVCPTSKERALGTHWTGWVGPRSGLDTVAERKSPRSCRKIIISHIWWRVQLKFLSLCNVLHSPATYSLLGPNVLLITPFSYTLNLYYVLDACYKSPPSHTPLFYHIMILLVMQCYPSSCCFLCHSSPNTSFSYSLKPCSHLGVGDQFSHLYIILTKLVLKGS